MMFSSYSVLPSGAVCGKVCNMQMCVSRLFILQFCCNFFWRCTILDFPSRLKDLRRSKGVTQKQLAIDINASERGIQNYEQSERKPACEHLIKLANYSTCRLTTFLA